MVTRLLAEDRWPPVPAIHAGVDHIVRPLPASVTAESTTCGAWRCVFTLRAETAHAVALVGGFNGWNGANHPMRRVDGGGVWKLTIDLEPGVHQYKFLVDGSRWLGDPHNPDRIADGFGGHNSVLKLGRLAYLTTSPATPRDGRIDALGLRHSPDSTMYRQSLGKGRLLLRYRVFTDDVDAVHVVFRDGTAFPMHVARRGPLFSIYEADVAVPSVVGAAPAEYTFVLSDGDTRVANRAKYAVDPRSAPAMSTPEWARHAVWYQIMLERFRDGDPTNNPTPVRPWTSEWFTPSPWEGRDGQTFYNGYVFARHYGGDLRGLEQQLPYLKDLGVNALYLNPIFKADSHHKYDATNYVHVDDHFGTKGDYDAVADQEDLLDPATWSWTPTDREFLRFLGIAHRMEFRVILDGVFNHVGTRHPAFQDVKRNGRASRFADWFDVIRWEPFRYNGWAGFSGLPVFKKNADGFASNAVKDHIFAVTRRWMDPDGDGDPGDGIDGWRLDVPNEVPAPFWVEWRRLVKSINPEAYITGEIWDRAESWLDGRRFDAVMNYPFAEAAVAWIIDRERKIRASEIDRRLADLRMAYPVAATYVLQNLMDSHDTDRLVSMAFNPDRDYDRDNRPRHPRSSYKDAKPSADAYSRTRLVVLLQMTYVGAPMIYYGDEAGMWGADDPTDRKPMLWSDLEPYDDPDENFVMKDHLDFYKRTVALRHAHPALRTGSFQTLLTDDAADVWAFLRTDERERVIVVLNASNTARSVRIPLPPDVRATSTAGDSASFRTVFGTAGDLRVSATAMSITIPPVDGVVLVATRPTGRG